MATAHPPARVAPIVGLSHVQLLVTDVEASAQWYSTVLSLTPYAEDLDIGYVALRQPGAKFVVVLTTAPDARRGSHGEGGRGSDDHGTGDDGVDHIAFAVSDGDALRAWAMRLTELGIQHGGVVLENGNPSLQLRDPDGIAIELVASA